jgi:hypothetical protein
LLQIAEERRGSQTTAFEDFVAEEGLTMEELKEHAKSVELE